MEGGLLDYLGRALFTCVSHHLSSTSLLTSSSLWPIAEQQQQQQCISQPSLFVCSSSFCMDACSPQLVRAHLLSPLPFFLLHPSSLLLAPSFLIADIYIAGLEIEVIILENVSCFGGNDGMAMVNVTDSEGTLVSSPSPSSPLSPLPSLFSLLSSPLFIFFRLLLSLVYSHQYHIIIYYIIYK